MKAIIVHATTDEGTYYIGPFDSLNAASDYNSRLLTNKGSLVFLFSPEEYDEDD